MVLYFLKEKINYEGKCRKSAQQKWKMTAGGSATQQINKVPDKNFIGKERSLGS